MKGSEILCNGGWLLMIVLAASCRTSAISRSGEANSLEEVPQSRIVFYKGNVGSQGIRVMNPDGTGLVQLTSEKYDMQPTWSPDGDLIAFMALRKGDFEVLGKYPLCMHFALHIMNSSGGEQRRIADVPVMTFCWSPDSNRIAFISGYENSENFGLDGIAKSALYVLNINNRKLRRLTDVEGKVLPELSWSPTGSRISYSTSVARKIYDISIVNADGSGQRRIVAGTNPKWSPDGKRILFRTETTGVQIIDIDGGNQKQVSATPGYVRLIGFSPDGKKILYSSYDKSINSLYVMGADGSNKIDLSKGMLFKVIDMPQFIENGTNVFFAGRKDGEWELFSVGIDGMNLKNLTDKKTEPPPGPRD